MIFSPDPRLAAWRGDDSLCPSDEHRLVTYPARVSEALALEQDVAKTGEQVKERVLASAAARRSCSGARAGPGQAEVFRANLILL